MFRTTGSPPASEQGFSDYHFHLGRTMAGAFRRQLPRERLKAVFSVTVDHRRTVTIERHVAIATACPDHVAMLALHVPITREGSVDPCFPRSCPGDDYAALKNHDRRCCARILKLAPGGARCGAKDGDGLTTKHHTHEVEMMDREIGDERVAKLVVPARPRFVFIGEHAAKCNGNRGDFSELAYAHEIRGALGRRKETKVLIDH